MAGSIPTTIMIVDDHPMIRQILKITIGDSSDLKIIGEACNGKEAIELSKNLSPDIVITDIQMPGINGLELTKQLIKHLPRTKIIALSMLDDEGLIVNMLDAGAMGYLLKDVFAEEVIIAIRTVLEGEKYFSRSISAKIVKMVAKGDYSSHKNVKPRLSQKETMIVKLICMEKSSKQIADELRLTKKAVDGLRDQILKKLDVANTAGLVRYAMRNKLCE